MDRSTAIGVGLLVIGLAILLTPLTFYSVHDSRYLVTPEPASEASPADESVVAFDSLSTKEQAAVDPYRSHGDHSSILRYFQPEYNDHIFTSTQWEAADGIRQHEYVTFGEAYPVVGETHRIEVDRYRATLTASGIPVWSRFISAVGLALLVVGAFAIRHRSVRSLTPTRAAVIPLATVPLLLVGAWLLTFTFPGGGFDPVPKQGFVIGAVTWTVLGSAVASGHRPRSFWMGLVLVGFVALNMVMNSYSVSNVVGAMTIVGILFGGLGYLFSARDEHPNEDRSAVIEAL
jgi:hypothetical protein